MTSSGGKEEGGSMLPTVLAGAGILLVAGLMIFWPDDGAETGAKKANQVSADGEDAKGTGRGGVARREADEAGGAPGAEPKIKPRINPRLQPATEFGMSNNPPKNEPPEFNDADEELVYWETQLSEAKRVLQMREKAIERLPKIREQIMAGNDPEAGLKAFERREEIIHDNLGKQKAKVSELEEKVVGLKQAKGG